MIVIGVCLLPIVYVWETRFAVYPIMPARFFRNKGEKAACVRVKLVPYPDIHQPRHHWSMRYWMPRRTSQVPFVNGRLRLTDDALIRPISSSHSTCSTPISVSNNSVSDELAAASVLTLLYQTPSSTSSRSGRRESSRTSPTFRPSASA